MKKYQVVILLFVLIVNVCNAQQVADDIASINQAYAENKHLKMETEYLLFRKDDTSKLFKKQAGVIEKSGSSVYSKIGEMEMIRTDAFSISVDNERKTMAYQKPVAGYAKEIHHGTPDFAYLLTLADTAFIKFSGKHERVMVLSFPNSEYDQVAVTYDSKKFFVSKLELIYNAVPDDNGIRREIELMILYRNIRHNAHMRSKAFDSSTYVTDQGGLLVCAKDFKDYKLLAAK